MFICALQRIIYRPTALYIRTKLNLQSKWDVVNKPANHGLNKTNNFRQSPIMEKCQLYSSTAIFSVSFCLSTPPSPTPLASHPMNSRTCLHSKKWAELKVNCVYPQPPLLHQIAKKSKISSHLKSIRGLANHPDRSHFIKLQDGYRSTEIPISLTLCKVNILTYPQYQLLYLAMQIIPLGYPGFNCSSFGEGRNICRWMYITMLYVKHAA